MNFINIRSYDNYVNANMQLGLLQEEGVNCHIKDENTITIDPLLSPAIGGMKLMVEESQVDRALRVLEAAEEAWLQTVPCSNCGNKTLTKKTEIKEFHSVWGKLKSMLLNGQEKEVRSFYQCTNCGKKFDKVE